MLTSLNLRQRLKDYLNMSSDRCSNRLGNCHATDQIYKITTSCVAVFTLYQILHFHFSIKLSHR